MGGSFDTLGGDLGPSRLGRLNADGTLDADFNPGVSSAGYCTVSALAVQADGRILVGGQFDTLGGSNRNDIGRLETNGVVDATFDPNADGAVFSLALQADGKILVAGGFWSLNGVSRYRGLARLAADGTPDPFVTPEAGYTKALAVQADGRVLVGGSSWSLNNVQIGCLGRLENTEAPTETIQAVDGAITWMRGSTAPEVARTTFECTTNGGSLWTMMGTGVRVQGGWRLEGGSEPLGTVRARGYTVGGGSDASSGIIESGLGAPVIEGEPASCTNGAGSTAIFTVWAVGSAPFSCTWRKNGVTLTDGAQVTGTTTTALSLNGVFGSDAGGYDVIVRNADGCVTSTVAVLTVLDPAITQQPFTQNSQLGDSVMFKVSAKGTGLSYQWWKDGAAVAGATDTTFNVDSVQASDVGYYDVVVHGTYGSVTSSVAAIEVNLVFGDTSFQPDPNGLVRALAVQPDGKILLGGGFMTLYADTVSRLRLARMNANGTLDDTFDPGAGDVVHALAVQADGGILVGGEFGTLGGLSCKCFGRLGTNGLLQAGAVPEADGSVNALVVQADGSVLLGGDFTTLDVTNSCNHLARLLPDGTLDTAFDPGADQPVCVLAVQADGCILVGGSFSTLGGSGHIGLGRLTADGVIDDTFNPVVDGQVQAVAVQADGKILVGGNFGTVNTTNRINIARLNQDGSLDESFDPGASGQVDTLVLQANGKILVGGSFYVIGNEAHPYLARLNTDGTPDAAFGPYVDSEVNALCLQADGGILAGGWFNGLADVSSPRVGRLCNTEPAIGTLTNNGATVTWLRGGAAPEAWQTTFEATTNGVDWTPLGFGMRIAGGWQLTGVQAASAAVHTALVVKPKTAKSGGTIATGTIIRARAYLSCGMWNGSGGIVETCLVVSAPSPMADSDGDGIPDSWTLQYFGHSTGQTGDLSCAVCDADGTGQNNLFKYVAGLDPTNSASVFRLDIKNVTGEATQKRLTFSPRWSDRIYTLQFCTNLTLGVPWADLTTAPANDNGDERTVTDQGATDASRFYRIQITLP